MHIRSYKERDLHKTMTKRKKYTKTEIVTGTIITIVIQERNTQNTMKNYTTMNCKNAWFSLTREIINNTDKKKRKKNNTNKIS